MSVLMRISRYIMFFVLLYSLMVFFESIKIGIELQNFMDEANVVVYELDEEIDFTFKQNDILLSRKSGHQNLLIADIISFYVGGHAGLVINEEGTETIEVFGYSGYENSVQVYENDWLMDSIEVIGLRTEPVSLEYDTFIGQPYDWFPFIPNNAKYCTELITATYQSTGLNLDYDYGIVTVNDILISRETDIFLYKVIKDNKIYIYWEE